MQAFQRLCKFSAENLNSSGNPLELSDISHQAADNSGHVTWAREPRLSILTGIFDVQNDSGKKLILIF